MSSNFNLTPYRVLGTLIGLVLATTILTVIFSLPIWVISNLLSNAFSVEKVALTYYQSMVVGLLFAFLKVMFHGPVPNHQ